MALMLIFAIITLVECLCKLRRQASEMEGEKVVVSVLAVAHGIEKEFIHERKVERHVRF
jgi:hypothetical protein